MFICINSLRADISLFLFIPCVCVCVSGRRCVCVCVCLNTGLCVMYVEDYVCVFMSTIVRTGGGAEDECYFAH